MIVLWILLISRVTAQQSCITLPPGQSLQVAQLSCTGGRATEHISFSANDTAVDFFFATASQCSSCLALSAPTVNCGYVNEFSVLGRRNASLQAQDTLQDKAYCTIFRNGNDGTHATVCYDFQGKCDFFYEVGTSNAG